MPLKPFNSCLKKFFLSFTVSIFTPRKKKIDFFKGLFHPLKVRMGTYKYVYLILN